MSGVRYGSSIIFLPVIIQFSQHYHLLERLSLPQWVLLAPWSNISWLYMQGFVSELWILFHWPMCLFLCHSHTVLITIALEYSLKSGLMMPSALFFFLSIALGIWGLLWFHRNFRTVFSISVKMLLEYWQELQWVYRWLWVIWTF